MKALLTYVWRSPAGYLFLIAAVLWGGFLKLSLGAVPFVFLAPCLVLLYAGLAARINRTVVECDGKHLKVRHTPLPWAHTPRLELSQLEELKVTQKARQSSSQKTLYFYNLTAVLKSGKEVHLLRHLPSKSRAQELLEELRANLSLS
jgi:hypothetical protein